MSYSIQTRVGDLLRNEKTKSILEKHVPGISSNPQIGMGAGFSLAVLASFSRGMITQDMLDAIDADLHAVYQEA